MTLQDGDLRVRIRFERAVTVRDPLGGEGPAQWVLVTEAWAKVTNNLAATSEMVAAGAERYREQVRIDIRPRLVDPQWRIVLRGRVFDIKSIAPSNAADEVAIIAVSGLKDAGERDGH